MEVGYDREGLIHVHFFLMASVMVAKEKQSLEMLWVVPPSADFANDPIPMSELDDDDAQLPGESFFPEASELHEAGINESGEVLLLPFDLTAKGFVIMKNTSAVVTVGGYTSNQLIRSLESLSNTSHFSVYIKPSDYSRQGLKEICKRLSNTGVATRRTFTKEIYVELGGMVVDWGIFRYHPRRKKQPPPYNGSPAPSSPEEVQAPQSLSMPLEREALSPDTPERVIPETPIRSPVDPNPAPVSNGISSSSPEVITGVGVNMGRVEEDLASIEPDTDAEVPSNVEDVIPVELELDICSDEEYLANERSREISQQIKDAEAVPGILESKLVDWLKGALTTSPTIYEHKVLAAKLLTLANCVRTSNTKLFHATIPWCSALLFYEPPKSEKTPESLEEKNRWVISDMAEMIKWANTFWYGVEVNPVLIDDFVKLGSTARNLAQRPGLDKAEYNHAKSVCIARVLIKFGRSGNNNGESSGPVSRKRAMEAGGNMPKRARNII